MSVAALRNRILGGDYDEALARLYGTEQIPAQRERYVAVVDDFAACFGEGEGTVYLFSAPGRTEMGGNHTDHNHGCVLAASVDLDAIAVVRATPHGIRVQSEGHEMNVVALEHLVPVAEEKNTSTALVRGVAARFSELGHAVGGFDAYTTTNVLRGSGLSSSAAFEVLLGVIINHLYNDGQVSPVEIAQIAQYAENVYYGKPCGLMDQMASAVGNVIAIDFADPAKPLIQQIDFDFAATGYRLCIVDVGGDHAGLTEAYATTFISPGMAA